MNKEQAIVQLVALVARHREYIAIVKRRRARKPSEQAMTLASYELKISALGVAISALEEVKK